MQHERRARPAPADAARMAVHHRGRGGDEAAGALDASAAKAGAVQAQARGQNGRANVVLAAKTHWKEGEKEKKRIFIVCPRVTGRRRYGQFR